MWWEFKESISIRIILLHDTEKYPVVMTSCFCRYIYRYLIYLVILKSPEGIFCQTNADIKNFVLISCTKQRHKQLFVNKTIKNCNGAKPSKDRDTTSKKTVIQITLALTHIQSFRKTLRGSYYPTNVETKNFVLISCTK